MSKAKRAAWTGEKRKKSEIEKDDRVEILNRGYVVGTGTVIRIGSTMVFVRKDSDGQVQNYYRSQLRLMGGSSSNH